MSAAIIERDSDLDEFGELSATAARELTDRIRAATDVLYEMLWRAHQGKVWKALGYSSWSDYCQIEIQMSARHSYRLLDFVEVRNAIRDSDPGVTPTSEKQVRALTKLERHQQPVAWKSAVADAGGKQPTAKQVEKVVAKTLSSGTGEPTRRRRSHINTWARESRMAHTRSLGVALEHAWCGASEAQQKRLLARALEVEKLRLWTANELKKTPDRQPSANAADPVKHEFDRLMEELLSNKDLMRRCILSFVGKDLGDVDGDSARNLLDSCDRNYDAPLTIVETEYEYEPKEIVEILLGLRAIES